MNMRLTFATLFLGAILLVGTPFAAHAQTAEQLRAQIAEILQQIYTLQSQLQTSSDTPTAVTPSDTNTATFQYSGCPDLQFNLERGNRDSQVAVEVTMLQRFLAQDPQIYPEGEITGYFGPATERAVQRFQVRHGIVTKGDYASTGYGRVGPRTRWAIKNSCAGSTSAVETYGFTVSPTQGPIDLEVTASFEFTGSSCTSYELDWGDGSSPETQQSQVNAECTGDFVRKTLSHTYATAGTYTVRLRIGRGALTTAPVIGQLQVVAKEKDEPDYPIDPNAKAFLTFSNTEGYAPFAAGMVLRSQVPMSCTSYELDWGDGTALVKKEAGTSPCLSANGYTKEFTHVYKNAGVYTIYVRAGRGALSTLPRVEQRIVVHNTRTGTASSCFVEPNNGIAPHSVRARVLLGGGLCDGNLTYSVDWGDGSVSAPRTCLDQNYHYEELTHTYLTAAIYTARLQQAHPNAYFDEEVCTVNVTASTNTGNNAVTNSCQSWTDGCNTCSRSYIGGPAACTQRYCLQQGTAQCYNYFETSTAVPTNDTLTFRILSKSTRTVEFTALINTVKSCDGGLYTLYFGDSQNSPQPYPADVCSSFERKITHKYAQDGAYTAVLLKDGVAIEQVNVVLNSTSSFAQKNIATVIITIENFIRSLFK